MWVHTSQDISWSRYTTLPYLKMPETATVNWTERTRNRKVRYLLQGTQGDNVPYLWYHLEVPT